MYQKITEQLVRIVRNYRTNENKTSEGGPSRRLRVKWTALIMNVGKNPEKREKTLGRRIYKTHQIEIQDEDNQHKREKH